MAHRALIVEDDEDVAHLLEYNLKAIGFDVVAVLTGHEAVARARAFNPHVVLLDIRLPDIDGYEVCRRLRANPLTAGAGVLMLTAHGQDEERILGFEVGADDYLVKPFVVRELVLRATGLAARIEAIRQPTLEPPGTMLRCGPILVDPTTFEVRVASGLVQLRPLEYKLLAFLIAKPGRVFSRAELLAKVWGVKGAVNLRMVDVHMCRMRDALGDAGEWIETVLGYGYKARRAAPTIKA